MTSVFDAGTIAGATLRNRFVMSPMSQHCAGEDGLPTMWHAVHYGSRAVGGVGLILIEDTAVGPEARVSNGSMMLASRESADAFAPIVDFCHEQGALVGIQLAHAGRKGRRDAKGHGHRTLAPSSEPFGEGWAEPEVATEEDLDRIIADFAEAASWASEAGMDAVEVHGSNGYLLHQFLSPATNGRSDRFGPSDGVGATLLLEVVRAVRERFSGVLLVRLPGADEVEGGLTSELVASVAERLSELGVDAFDVAGGTLTSTGTPVAAEIQVRTARLIRERTGKPVLAGASIRSAGIAAQRVADGDCDFVVVGVPLLHDPYFVNHACEEQDRAPHWPTQYPL